VHLVTDGRGLPLAVECSPGQASEALYLEPVLNAMRVPHHIGRPGRPRQRPDALAADRGYSFRRIRHWLRAHKIVAVIPERRDQITWRKRHGYAAPSFDRAAYRRRNVIERCVGWLKEARRVATRYEKLAVHYLVVLKLAMIEKYLQVYLANTP
jgi:transposase